MYLELLQLSGNAATIVRVTLAEHFHASLLDELLGIDHMTSNVVHKTSLLLFIQHVTEKYSSLTKKLLKFRILHKVAPLQSNVVTNKNFYLSKGYQIL